MPVMGIFALMRLMNIHAHYDDFEFTACGTFAQFMDADREGFRGRVTVCTDGAAGHHRMSRDETAAVRLQEQESAMAMAGFELETLEYPDGARPKEGQMTAGPEMLAALWMSIRSFQPDYLFCPPLPSDVSAGLHVDHVVVAESIRRVAYLLNVPQAYTNFYPQLSPPWESIRTPVILTVADSYMGTENPFDLVVDISERFDLVCETSWCHQSQIREWLPWVGRHQFRPPENYSQWCDFLRQRVLARQQNLGLPTDRIFELFSLTAWGEIPGLEELLHDFPGVDTVLSPIAELGRKIRRWKTQGT